MAEEKQFKEFRTQSGIKQYNYNLNDNLFTGVWNLEKDNLATYDPFITGYSFIVWTKLPTFFYGVDGSTGTTEFVDRFKHMTEKNFKSFSGLGDISLNVEDITGGFTGNAYGVATGIQKENTGFTLAHQELAGSPIRELYTYWITGIRDMETGLATYHGKIGKTIDGKVLEYSMQNQVGELLYIKTDPAGGRNGSGIEFACYYTNVMPTKIPQDHLNYTSGDHNVVEISMDFRGTFHMSEEINALASAYLRNNYANPDFAYNKTFADYKQNSYGLLDGIKDVNPNQ